MEEELEQPEESQLDLSLYFNQTSMDELRRYVCLDMARLSGALPDKMVKLASDMERYLIGKNLKAVE